MPVDGYRLFTASSHNQENCFNAGLQMIAPISSPSGQLQPQRAGDADLLSKAKDLEAAFLAEMLSFTGLGEVSEGFVLIFTQN